MRVTFVTRRYWPAIGGVERVAMTLGEGLVEAGHEVRVIAQCIDEGHFGRMTHIIRENKLFSPFALHGVEVVQFRPSRLRRSALLPFALELIPLGGRVSRTWLRRHSAGYYAKVVKPVLSPLLAGSDVIHVLGGEVMAVAAVEAARSLDVPVVASPFAHPGHWGYDAGSIRAYRDADLVIATTNADADAYRAIGVPPDRLEIVGLAVEAPPVLEAPRPRDSAVDASPLVTFLGARRPTKGVDVLLAAAPQVWTHHPDARFAFVGPGDPLSTEDGRILDVGRVSDAERAAWLSRTDVLCLPSMGESFGLVLPEAWSHEVPVVVSDIPVLRELVEASAGGIAVPREPAAVAGAIADLLSSPVRRRRMGEAGHAYWKNNLSPDAVLERHLALYERVIAGRRPSRGPSASTSSYAVASRSAAASTE